MGEPGGVFIVLMVVWEFRRTWKSNILRRTSLKKRGKVLLLKHMGPKRPLLDLWTMCLPNVTSKLVRDVLCRIY